MFEPYTDEPDDGLDDDGILLQQRQIMQGTLPFAFAFLSVVFSLYEQTKTHISTIYHLLFTDNIISRFRSMTSWRCIRGCWIRWIPSWMGRTRGWRVHEDGWHVSPAGQRRTVRRMGGPNTRWIDLSLASTVTIGLLILVLLILIVVFKT